MATILIVNDSDAERIIKGYGSCVEGPTVQLTTEYDEDGAPVYRLACSLCGDVTPERANRFEDVAEAGAAHIDRYAAWAAR